MKNIIYLSIILSVVHLEAIIAQEKIITSEVEVKKMQKEYNAYHDAVSKKTYYMPFLQSLTKDQLRAFFQKENDFKQRRQEWPEYSKDLHKVKSVRDWYATVEKYPAVFKFFLKDDPDLYYKRKEEDIRKNVLLYISESGAIQITFRTDENKALFRHLKCLNCHDE